MTRDLGNLRPGEISALLEAGSDGWIHPPVTSARYPDTPRTWLSADLYRLNARGLVRERRRWLDALWSYRLSDEGRDMVQQLLDAGHVRPQAATIAFAKLGDRIVPLAAA